MARTPKKTEADFSALLKTTGVTDSAKRAQIIQARIILLGHGTYCSRCGGTGNYSFNLMDGTRCYGCDGTRYGTTKLTNELYAALEKDVEAGLLDTKIEEARERMKIKKICNTAEEVVMQAWHDSQVTKAYDWQLAVKGIQPDRLISDVVNKPMCDAYTATCNAVKHVNSFAHKLKRAQTASEAEAIRLEMNEAMAQVQKVRDESLATIEQARQKLQEILAEQSA
ncbi:hypothetical protein ACI2KR_06400 [Pseudomonas luteola]